MMKSRKWWGKSNKIAENFKKKSASSKNLFNKSSQITNKFKFNMKKLNKKRSPCRSNSSNNYLRSKYLKSLLAKVTSLSGKRGWCKRSHNNKTKIKMLKCSCLKSLHLLSHLPLKKKRDLNNLLHQSNKRNKSNRIHLAPDKLSVMTMIFWWNMILIQLF